MRRITGIVFRAGFNDNSLMKGETRRRSGGLSCKQLDVAASFWSHRIDAMRYGEELMHGATKKRYIMLEIEREGDIPPPATGFETLCRRVERIDQKAAMWMRQKGIKRSRFGDWDDCYPLLVEAFDWGKTPQGYKFWNVIDDRLNAGEA